MKKSKIIFEAVCIVLSVLCLLYFGVLIAKTGISSTFNFFWLFLVFMFTGVFFVSHFAHKSLSKVPKPLKIIIEIVVLIGLCLFILIEGLIIFTNNNTKSVDADYIVILGAKVNGAKPSLTLRYRLDKALEYINAHNNVKIVVSGGKGSNEDISEALAMKNYLVENGVSGDRIIMEDKSKNTYQNLKFTSELIDKDKKVVVVSNDFHVFRACKLANKAGYTDVYGMKAKSVWYLIPTNYVREFIGVLKDFLVGNI